MPHLIDAADLSTGVRIPYVERGDRDGTPVILLHGISDSWRSFEPVLPYLPASLRAFALSQRGHGDATRPCTYDVHDYAEDAAAFLDAMGLERAIVAGHSMGSIVATRLAIDHPERVAGLVLMGARPTFVDADFVAVGEELAQMADPVDRSWLREFQLSTVARPMAPDFLDMVVGESAKLPLAVLRAAWDGVLLTDFSGELGKVTAPTLIAWGDADTMCPRADQDALVEAIPDATLRVYEGLGHALHWDDPAGFAAHLAAFARGV
jgi:non-heme chloroperoxidase